MAAASGGITTVVDLSMMRREEMTVPEDIDDAIKHI